MGFHSSAKNTILGYAYLGLGDAVLTDDEKKKLLGRLRRIEGQAGGLIRMVEEGKYCVDILQQIAAVQGALAQASKMLVRSHLETCVVGAFNSKKAGEKERVTAELVDLFARINRAGPTN